jgi:uncharacterized membrane protein
VRLNGWQQIGALASVVWVLVGPVYLINKDTHHATKQASLAMRACYKAGRKDCLKVYDTTYAASRDIKPTWSSWAILAFVPMVAAWLVVWGLLALFRWIRAGFRSA